MELLGYVFTSIFAVALFLWLIGKHESRKADQAKKLRQVEQTIAAEIEKGVVRALEQAMGKGAFAVKRPAPSAAPAAPRPLPPGTRRKLPPLVWDDDTQTWTR